MVHATINQRRRLIDGGRVEWIGSNVFDVGRSSTGSEGIEKHLKRQKGEGVETESICNVGELQ